MANHQSQTHVLEQALVSSNVYDTASWRYLLIPQGSRLVGVHNSRIATARTEFK
jgi:type IV secretory pathway VirB10-like protein